MVKKADDVVIIENSKSDLDEVLAEGDIDRLEEASRDALRDALNAMQAHPLSGIIKSIIAHLHLVWVHPFGDGNGRTARLLEVRFLMEAGIPSAAAHLLSNFYNKTRSEYYRRLDEASKNGGDVQNFIFNAVSGFVDELRSQLIIVKHEQWLVAWTNHVHEKFRGRESIPISGNLSLS